MHPDSAYLKPVERTYKVGRKIQFWKIKMEHLQGPRNDLILGGAHCFSTFDNATFLKKFLILPQCPIGSAVPEYLYRIAC